MINLHITLRNYFSKENFKNLYTKSFKLSKNKMFELQIVRYDYNWIDFEINTNFSGYDHAGPSLELGLLGFIIYVKIYDKRHWNHIDNTWESCSHN